MKSEIDTLPTKKKKQTSILAIVSFVIGVPNLIILFVLTILGRLPSDIDCFSLFLIPFTILSITTFICGMIAVNKIGKRNDLKGIGFAITGLITATLILFPIVIALLVLTAIYIHLIPWD
jgi:hypothetical protein